MIVGMVTAIEGGEGEGGGKWQGEGEGSRRKQQKGTMLMTVAGEVSGVAYHS